VVLDKFQTVTSSPAVSHLVSHWNQAVTSSTFQRIDTDLAAVGSRGLEVHKEIFLLVPQLFEMVLERINSGDETYWAKTETETLRILSETRPEMRQ